MATSIANHDGTALCQCQKCRNTRFNQSMSNAAQGMAQSSRGLANSAANMADPYAQNSVWGGIFDDPFGPNGNNHYKIHPQPNVIMPKVPQVKGDVFVMELILMPEASTKLPKVQYACPYYGDPETLAMNPQLYNSVLMLKAGLSGFAPNALLKLPGVGTARYLEDGFIYMRILYE